jgi:hypothetical protein
MKAMNQKHELHVSQIILDHGNKLITAHLHQITGQELANSFQRVKKTLTALDRNCSPHSELDIKKLKKFQNDLIVKHVFQASKLIKFQSKGINLGEHRYKPFSYFNLQEFSKKSLDVFQWEFAWATFERIQGYLVQEMKGEYRDSLEEFLFRVQKNNSSYFEFLGFKKTGTIKIKEIEQKLARLKVRHNITVNNYP